MDNSLNRYYQQAICTNSLENERCNTAFRGPLCNIFSQNYINYAGWELFWWFYNHFWVVSLPLVASPRTKRICNLLCSDRHNPDVTQRKYPIAPRKCQIVVSKMLYGTDTHPNMAPARYKQPVAMQLWRSSWINRLIRDPRGDCRWNKRRMDQKSELCLRGILDVDSLRTNVFAQPFCCEPCKNCFLDRFVVSPVCF